MILPAIMVLELKYAGHDQVVIILGGWPEWLDNKFPVEKDLVKVESAFFVADVQPQLLVISRYVMNKMGDPNPVILDACSLEQYKGDAKHPAAKIGGRLPALSMPLRSPTGRTRPI